MKQASQTDIIVLGACGRMGSAIIRLLESEPGFKLAAAVEMEKNLGRLSNLACLVTDSLDMALDQAPHGVIIDFTAPASTMAAAKTAAERQGRMVIGTTGLDAEQKQELEQLALKTPILWSANMSIGINVLLRLLPMLAAALGPAYDMEMVEIHHRHKKDAPSGTALMLGEAMAKARQWDLDQCRCSCRDGIIGGRPEKQIGIQALRGGDVVGIHQCYFLGPGETIEVSHQAESRENFAQGALRAAKWLSRQDKGRLYSVQDVIAAAQ